MASNPLTNRLRASLACLKHLSIERREGALSKAQLRQIKMTVAIAM